MNIGNPFRPRPVLLIAYPASALAEDAAPVPAIPVPHLAEFRAWFRQKLGAALPARMPVSEAARVLSAASRKPLMARREAIHAGLRQAVTQ